MRRNRLLASGAALTAAVVLASGGIATASTTPALAATGGFDSAVTVGGTSVTLSLKLGANGSITGFTATPSTGLAQTSVTPARVMLARPDGTASAMAKASRDTASVKIGAASLAALGGAAGFSATLLGGPVTQPFTVGANGAKPTLTLGAATLPSGVTATTKQETSTRDGKANAEAKVTMRGATGTAVLKLDAEAPLAGGPAELKVELRVNSRIPVSALAGAKTWSGTLCDGSAASFGYTVNPNGTIVAPATTTPAGSQVRAQGRQLRVTFATRDRVTIKVLVKRGNAVLSIVQQRRSCRPLTSSSSSTSTSSSAKVDHGGRPRHGRNG